MANTNFASALHDVDIRLLRVFMTVVDAGGFTAAELPLGISRSAISKHMADLESRTGLKLCHRGRGGFELTESGREVWEAAEQLLQSLDEFRGRISRLHSELRGSLHIGVVDNTVSDPASPLISAMRKMAIQSPGVEMTLSIMSSATMEAALLEDRIHIGVIPRRSSQRDQLIYRKLYSETSRLYCGKGHPLYFRNNIVDDDLRNQRIISPSHAELRQLIAVLGDEVGDNAASAIARNVEGTAMFLLTGQYIGFLPAHVGHPLEMNGLIRPIRADDFTVHTAMDVACRNRRELNPILMSFIDELKT